MTSHVFDFNLKLLLRSLAGSLEGHVLQEMGGTVVGSRFVSGSGINPYTDSSGLTSSNSLGTHSKSIVQGSYIGCRSPQDVVWKARKGSRGDSGVATGRGHSLEKKAH